MNMKLSATGAYRVQPVSPAASVGDRKPNGDRKPHADQQRRLTREEMEEQDGIKAQHAAAKFVVEYLKALNNGWEAEETEVGGHYDRQGFDLLLTETKTGRVIPVDFSFCHKDDAAVRYQRDWFDIRADGVWVFRKECAQLLFRQFIKVMSSNQHFSRKV